MIDTLPFRISICGIAELPEHSSRGVSHVLSILDPEWPVPDAFGGYGEHARLELRFNDIIEDGTGLIAPNAGHVQQILAFGRDLLAEPAAGRSLLVHCHAGVSRSTAAMLLLLAQALPDATGEDLAAMLVSTRPQAWPNLRIVEIGDAELRRGGALIAGAVDIYRAQMRRHPEYAGDMASFGRAREVVLAQGRP